MGPPDTWVKMADWLGNLGTWIESKATRPEAIVVISAHWEEQRVAVMGHSHSTLLFDYYGFPLHTYQLKYEAPGAPWLAMRITELLGHAGIPTRVENNRGLDHGVFVPFKLIYPKADIPILQLSLHASLDPAFHLAMGYALAPLRQEGVLIVGSGMSYHNMQGFRDGGAQTQSDSKRFDTWLTHQVEQPDILMRNNALEHWNQGFCARSAHPREEHLLPLMVAAGAANEDIGHKIFTDNVMNAQVSAFCFGNI
jgi:aromatic ring-opening dioxygenase catalytic subunit (LigB family)